MVNSIHVEIVCPVCGGVGMVEINGYGDVCPECDYQKTVFSKLHVLKTWSNFFQAIKSGTKTHELRQDDRNFKVGDVLCLVETFPDEENNGYDLHGNYLGEKLFLLVIYKLTHMDFSPVPIGWCDLSIKPLDKRSIHMIERIKFHFGSQNETGFSRPVFS